MNAYRCQQRVVGEQRSYFLLAHVVRQIPNVERAVFLPWTTSRTARCGAARPLATRVRRPAFASWRLRRKGANRDRSSCLERTIEGVARGARFLGCCKRDEAEASHATR